MQLLEVHLEVADLDKSLQLYKKLIPHRKLDQWGEGTAAALILENGSAFGLWKKGKLGIHNGRGGEHVHFAFRIEPHEYATCLARVKASGLEALEYTWPNGHRSIYFFDYDNHQGEFMTTSWE